MSEEEKFKKLSKHIDKVSWQGFIKELEQLQQENQQLKEEIKILKMIVYGLDNGDLFPTEICKLIVKISDEIDWNEYLKFQGDK